MGFLGFLGGAVNGIESAFGMKKPPQPAPVPQPRPQPQQPPLRVAQGQAPAPMLRVQPAPGQAPAPQPQPNFIDQAVKAVQNTATGIWNSGSNLTNIGLGAGAMGVDALAHLTGNKNLSTAVQPYVKGTIGSVPWVQNAAAQKQNGNNAQAAKTIIGGSLNDASNVAAVLPAGKLAETVVKGAPLLTRIIKGAKIGGATGAAGGGATGYGDSLQSGANAQQTIKNVVTGAATGGVTGLALGTAAPVAGDAIKAAVKGVQAGLTPTVAHAGFDPNAPIPGEVPPTNRSAMPQPQTKPLSGAEKTPSRSGELTPAPGKEQPQNLPAGSLGKESPPQVVSKSSSSADSNIEVPKSQAVTDKQMADALKMTPEDLAAARRGTAANRKATAPVEAKVTHAQELAAEQTKATQEEINRRGTGAANPFKLDLPAVAPGDHAKAISNGQLAGNPIEHATDLVARGLDNLSAKDHANFPRMIEHPELVAKADDPRAVQQVIDDHKVMSDMTHGTGQAVKDQPIAYRNKWALHDWNLPEGSVTPNDSFSSIHEQARLHDTIEHGEAVGLTLKDRPYAEAVREYGFKAANALRRQAMEKGIIEADKGAKLTDTFNTGGTHTIEVSDAAKKALQGSERPPKTGIAFKVHDKINKFLKQTLLSGTQFHPINISVFKAAPALAFPKYLGKGQWSAGHPMMGLKGIADTWAAVSREYSDNLTRQALKEGTLHDAARIGTPIREGSDYSVDGAFSPGKHGVGERTIFGQQMPAMHIQMVRGVIADLKQRGIDLNSPAARQAGTRVNEIMGFVNKQVRGLSSAVQRGLQRLLLAPQFTRAKWATLKGSVTEKGVAGAYAKSAVMGNTAALLATQFALGALFGQKQDNWRDTMIRALIHPSIATPFKDSKGNTIDFGLPASYLSEAAGLLGNLNRGTDGRLGVSVDINKVPGNIASYGKGRLAPLESDTLKVVTNENYAGKPLYSDSAPLGTKVAQGATTLAVGHLPIGIQGLAYTDFVKNHMPSDVKQVLDAGSPGTNPLLKLGASDVGLSARIDTTTGKGQQTSQYFNAFNSANNSLQGKAKDAFNLAFGGTKDPVSGKYLDTPNSNMTPAKYQALLAYPQALAAANKMNQTLAAQGQKVDPFFLLNSDKQKAYAAYETMAPNDPNRANWQTINNGWYKGFAADQSAFFNSLPKGDPNRPVNPIQFPTPAPAVAALQSAYDTNSANWTGQQKSNFLSANPSLPVQWAAQTAYDNQVRVARGYSPVKIVANASPQLAAFTKAYFAASSAGKKAMNGDPMYRLMQGQLVRQELASIDSTAGQARLQGSPDTTNQELKDMRSVVDYGLVNTGTASNPILSALGATPSPGSTTSSNTALPFGGSANSSGYTPYVAPGSNSPHSDSAVFNLMKSLSHSGTAGMKTRKLSVPKGAIANLTKIPKPGRVSMPKFHASKPIKGLVIRENKRGHFS